MKKSILLLLIIFSTSPLHAGREKISSYDELLFALKIGKDVKAIINLENCTTTAPAKALKMSASLYGFLYRMNFDVFGSNEVTDENGEKHYAVIHSLSGYTEHPDLGPVLTYTRIRVLDNNQIALHNTLYTPNNYEKILTVDFHCHIGSDNKSVQFWANTSS